MRGQYSGLGLDVDTVSVDYDQYAFTVYLGKSPIPTQDIALKFYTSYSDVPNYSLDYESPFILTYHDSVVATVQLGPASRERRLAGLAA
jgi:hypothetical protein